MADALSVHSRARVGLGNRSQLDAARADDEKRRDFLVLAAAAMGTAGVGLAAWPLIDNMNPARDTLAAATTEVDLAPIEVGQRITVKWRGKPVFISHRAAEEIEEARSVDVARLRDPETDEARTQRAEWLIVVGICTHLGCVPLGQRPQARRGGWKGWYCACHGSQYDTSGRIRMGPAPENLAVPPYQFVDDMVVRVG